MMTAAAEGAAGPGTFAVVTQIVNLVAVVVAMGVLIGRRRLDRGAGSTWALSIFGIFGLVIFAGLFGVVDDGTFWPHTFTVVVVSVLVLVPYALVRFATALGALGTTASRIALGLTLGLIVLTVFSPPFPAVGEPRSSWFIFYVTLLYVVWSVLSGMSAAGLWRAGRGQPHLVRNRLRTLAIGELVMVLALLSGSGNAKPGSAGQVVTTLIGVLAIYLLVMAFVVPPWLRAAWRSKDIEQLGDAERSLMVSVSAQEVADVVVPAVVKLFGASGAAVLAEDGTPVSSQGVDPDQLEYFLAWASNASTTTEGMVVERAGMLGCRLDAGWLMVQAGIAAPIFGAGELALLERVASFGTLAMERCRLFEQEAVSRQAAEAVNAELQTLIYSVSHDLRNPVLSILGYIEVLNEEHSGELQNDGEHYLERISINALYIQNLIQDLLELSRIGRTEPPSTGVSLSTLVESVAEETRVLHPGCEVTVDGALPTVWMSELRARQLFTNLLENAAKYSPGSATIRVHAVWEPGGGATVQVSDAGQGIAERHREKALEVFERLDAARSDIPGTGMGLPICKRILELIGGSIELAGNADGSAGTTVRLRFPAQVLTSWSEPQPEREGAS